MKIQKVTLKDVEIREINGEFERIYTNEKSYPAFLTNFAMKKGKEMGLVESSLFSDLLKLRGLEGLSNVDMEQVDPAVFDSIDETKMHQIIYLAFNGANKTSEFSFDEFLQKYHYSFNDTIELYANLITDLISSEPNAFATELKKSTSNSNKNKKKYKPHR
jgi:hypothetical protein